MRIDLVVPAAAKPPSWPLGELRTYDSPSSRLLARARDSGASHALVWTCDAPPPAPSIVEALAFRDVDIWHGGHGHGLLGEPALLDFVSPASMFNARPDPTREVSSWRVSFHATLVRTAALAGLPHPFDGYLSASGCSLDWGHRCMTSGAIMRHSPLLAGCRTPDPVPSPRDQALFLARRSGRGWAVYAIARAVAVGLLSVRAARDALRVVLNECQPPPDPRLPLRMSKAAAPVADVAVVVPTVNRYPYLRTVLGQLREQTVAPREIVVVDQTELQARQLNIGTSFADLPITILHRDIAGQCSSRNAALQHVRSEYVLFIDDDDEVDQQLIERHLMCINAYGADSSSGIAHELETGPPPPLPETRRVRLSEVFPTNNTLVRRDALVQSGLFDLAYERHPRADGDLGMRLYLSGALMMLDDGNRVLHHRAPSGGLRQHKARVVTARTSRTRLLHRHLPAVSEIYMLHRYFSPRQRTEMLWIRALTTLVGHGPWYRRGLKALVGLAMLPVTVVQIRARAREAVGWLSRFPQIESL